MRVLILTHGTRGDVQPYAGLAHALRLAGHEAVLAAPVKLSSLADSFGFRYAPVDDGPIKLMNDPVVRGAMATNYRGCAVRNSPCK